MGRKRAGSKSTRKGRRARTARDAREADAPSKHKTFWDYAFGTQGALVVLGGGLAFLWMQYFPPPMARLEQYRKTWESFSSVSAGRPHLTEEQAQILDELEHKIEDALDKLPALEKSAIESPPPRARRPRVVSSPSLEHLRGVVEAQPLAGLRQMSPELKERLQRAYELAGEPVPQVLEDDGRRDRARIARAKGAGRASSGDENASGSESPVTNSERLVLAGPSSAPQDARDHSRGRPKSNGSSGDDAPAGGIDGASGSESSGESAGDSGATSDGANDSSAPANDETSNTAPAPPRMSWTRDGIRHELTTHRAPSGVEANRESDHDEVLRRVRE